MEKSGIIVCRNGKGSEEMLESSLAYIVIRSIPESIILMLSGFILLDLKLDTKRIIKLGLILGGIISLIRKLPITFGVHTILSMVVLGVILFKISNKSFMEVIITPCDIWISLALSEAIYYIIATGLLRIDSEVLTDYQSIQGAVSTLPSLLILLMVVLVIKSMKKKLMRSF